MMRRNMQNLIFEVRKSVRKNDGSVLIEDWSQWSLTFEVRKSPTLAGCLITRLVPQWSLTFEVRKRARDFFGFWLLVLHGFASAGQLGVCSGVVRLLWVG